MLHQFIPFAPAIHIGGVRMVRQFHDDQPDLGWNEPAQRGAAHKPPDQYKH